MRIFDGWRWNMRRVQQQELQGRPSQEECVCFRYSQHTHTQRQTQPLRYHEVEEGGSFLLIQTSTDEFQLYYYYNFYLLRLAASF